MIGVIRCECESDLDGCDRHEGRCPDEARVTFLGVSPSTKGHIKHECGACAQDTDKLGPCFYVREVRPEEEWHCPVHLRLDTIGEGVVRGPIACGTPLSERLYTWHRDCATCGACLACPVPTVEQIIEDPCKFLDPTERRYDGPCEECDSRDQT